MVGAFIPGQAVSLRSLARWLGTSLQPVREAVSRLMAERALEMVPNRAVVVPRMTHAKFSELCRLREQLEGLAAEEACRSADPSLHGELTRINAELRKAVSQGDVARILERNQVFHFTLYRASGFEIVLPMIESLWLQAGPFIFYSLNSPATVWNTSHHNEALDALAQPDPRQCRRAIQRDIRTTADYLLNSPVLRP
jgi:DNA-binding GntR family transcriptional regulator